MKAPWRERSLLFCSFLKGNQLSPPLRTTCIAAMAFAFGSIHAAAPTFSIDAHAISAGTSVHSSAPCFTMQATIAEPAPGYSSSMTYSLSAGFRYVTQNIGSDTIFFSGFEDCTP